MPSNAVLEAKKAKVEKLTEVIKNSVSGVLVDYKGITVEEDTKLRKELREAGVNYFVEKNTMLIIIPSKTASAFFIERTSLPKSFQISLLFQ